MISYDLYCDNADGGLLALLEIGLDKAVLDAMTDDELMMKFDEIKVVMNGDY